MAITTTAKGFVATTSWAAALTAGASERIQCDVTVSNTSTTLTPTVSIRLSDSSAVATYNKLSNVAFPPASSIRLPMMLDPLDAIEVLSDTASIVVVTIDQQVAT
jgi:hypothetical protein